MRSSYALCPFEGDAATVAMMNAFLGQKAYANDLNAERLHHEIYLSNPRKMPPEKWKTVIRLPIKKA